MTITNPAFEAAHPREAGGKFVEKADDAPNRPLDSAGQVRVTPYLGDPIADRAMLPTVPSEHSMALSDDQAGCVWTFAEEHRLTDGRYLSTVQYVYPAYAGDGQMAVVTETEQFVADHPCAYEANAHLVREGATWDRYDSAPVVCSVERAMSMAKRSAEDAHLHQTYFTSTVPWTGEPLAATAAEFREACERLNHS